MLPLPTVRYFLVCETRERDAGIPEQLRLANLMSNWNATGDPPFPCRIGQLSAVAVLAGCRGRAEIEVTCCSDVDELEVFKSGLMRRNYDNDPLRIRTLFFRLRQCEFPAADVYRMEFWYNGMRLAKQVFRITGAS